VLPKPADWPEHVHFTGFWFTPDGSAWQPPAGLQAFLEAGSPFVVSKKN
jgi:sterol 3beta-glucosyltransferase